MWIFFIFYDILLLFIILIYSPVYLLRGKVTLESFRERLGFLPKFKAKDAIWIQAVSVGEVLLLSKLVEELSKKFSNPIVISTTTLAGKKIADDKYSSIAKIIYFPVDISLIVKKVIATIKPKIFIAVETEIWPNIFYRLKKRGIPTLIVNARISDKAFSRYLLIKALTTYALTRCDYITCQNDDYLKKLIALGCLSKKIAITGNMKFESTSINPEKLSQIKQKYTQFLKGKGQSLILAASTHNPEEISIIDTYKELLNNKRNVSLIIAPRHVQRANEIANLLIKNDITPLNISSFSCDANLKKPSALVLDTIGELVYFYNLADICFVGGSLIGHGGQNILEPIYFRKPTIFGPHMENFRSIVEIVLDKGAGIQINKANELTSTIENLLDNPKIYSDISEKCQAVFSQNLESVSKNLEIISKYLK